MHRLTETILSYALSRPKREEFLHIFLNQGFQVHKYLSPKRLRQLFVKIQHEEFFRSVCWEGALGRSLLSKIGKNFIEVDLNWLIETTTGLRDFVDPEELSMNTALGMYIQAICGSGHGCAGPVPVTPRAARTTILSVQSVDWKYKKAVDIAAEAENRTFLAHPCCQKWLTNQFLGRISVRDITWGVLSVPLWLKIILCAFTVLPMYLWVRFKSDPHQMDYGDVRSKNISEDRKHRHQAHRHQLHQVKWQELTEDCEGKLGHIEAELNEEPEERAEFEKQVEELRQEEAGKARLEERKREP
ncbi:hypothetical protein HPB47_011734 [Ixodes persulcatus]|uniref:Uncharacterized protein n=1 Tax=Ixodes persulcatus TaxID=34615 RepID=A0AC60NVQ0_IXOPE|nr:hypothetical protein HPB47_011734 [Ixodes persulcatus]